MVPLESKATYTERIQESPKLKAFNDYLSGIPIITEVSDESSESDELFYGIIASIQKDNREEFISLYNKKSKSNPSKESPFVNDDFLIFCLLIGVVKYKLDRAWLKKIIGIRNKTKTTITLENLLNENYYSKDNSSEIVVIYFQINASSLISNDLLNTAFKSINANSKLFENKSDFQILCALKAYESIIVLKTASEGNEIQLLRKFKINFTKRIKIISWILQSFLLLAFLYSLRKLPIYSPNTIELINKYGYIFTILGALGITFFTNQISFIKKKSQELTMRALGYPIELIKTEKLE